MTVISSTCVYIYNIYRSTVVYGLVKRWYCRWTIDCWRWKCRSPGVLTKRFLSPFFWQHQEIKFDLNKQIPGIWQLHRQPYTAVSGLAKIFYSIRMSDCLLALRFAALLVLLRLGGPNEAVFIAPFWQIRKRNVDENNRMTITSSAIHRGLRLGEETKTFLWAVNWRRWNCRFPGDAVAVTRRSYKKYFFVTPLAVQKGKIDEKIICP